MTNYQVNFMVLLFQGTVNLIITLVYHNMSFIFIPDIQAHQLELNRPRNQATPTRMHLFRSPVYA